MKKREQTPLDEKINEERSKRYKKAEIPESLTRTLYVSYGVGHYNAGEIDFTQYMPEKNSKGFEKVLIGYAESVATIEKNIDIKGKVLRSLKRELATVRAENYIREQEVENKIKNLLALTHEPKEN